MKVKYEKATGKIVAWGEQLEPDEQHGVVDNVAPDLLQYVSLVGSVDVTTGTLLIDEAKLKEVRSAPPPPKRG